MASSIWGSVEMDAASRDFNYEDYVSYHERSACVGAKLSPRTYALLRMLFQVSLDEAQENDDE
jgi:hypothetical protein